MEYLVWLFPNSYFGLLDRTYSTPATRFGEAEAAFFSHYIIRYLTKLSFDASRMVMCTEPVYWGAVVHRV